jgi:superfamily II DNA or RNA helicase
MATGTGKTVTSLSAAVKRLETLKKLSLIILVPYLHLLDQWRRNCEEFGFLPILCSGEHRGWQQNVQSKIQDFNFGAISNICIIAVHDTGASERFGKCVKRLPTGYTMLIGDEVHALGSPRMQRALLHHAAMRLGLSATPKRWFDEEGTERIFSYFERVCFELTIDQAIGRYLTPYLYHPVPVYLSPNELSEYEDLSRKISIFGQQSEKNTESEETLKKLLIKRSKIIASTEKKIPKLLSILKYNIKAAENEGKELRNILIYCFGRCL